MTRVRIRVSPNCQKETVTVDGEEIHARVSAPPIDGRANLRLQSLLADRLGLPKSAVTVVRGGASRIKTVDVAGLDLPGVISRLMRDSVDHARPSKQTGDPRSRTKTGA